LVLLVVALAAVIACYVMVQRVAPLPDRSHLLKPGMQMTPKEDTREYEEVAVTIEIPPLSEFPRAWAEIDGCPHIRMCGALDAQLSGGGGVRVLAVKPGGPAAKAGLKPGDVFGEPEDCASGLVRFFAPRTEAHTVEWTVRRPKGWVWEPPAAEGTEPRGTEAPR
jgi:membrane-associated protease RseP (regulator of RpoE activity)